MQIIYIYIYIYMYFIYIIYIFSMQIIYIYMYFRFFSPYMLLKNSEYNSMYYTVGPCWLSVLYIVVCIC